MELFLAQPRGFCAGVVRAIDIVELALETYPAPIYVYHEIVHNHHVVADLRKKGAIFVDDINEIPAGGVTIFSAHGVSDAVVDQAKLRELNVVDATCPLVTKVHLQGKRYSDSGHVVIIVGHAGHQEVIGTIGSIPGECHVVGTVEEVEQLAVSTPERIAYVTQTTLSLDDTRDVIEALKQRFPSIVGPGLNDICYATQNRQNAVHDMAKRVDLVLVIGSQSSSNSNRLRDVAEQYSIPAYLIEDASQLDPTWLQHGPRIGITSGASAPDHLVQALIERLRGIGDHTIHHLDGIEENTVFRLPRGLLDANRIAVAQDNSTAK